MDLRSFPMKTWEGTVDSLVVIGTAVRGSGLNLGEGFRRLLLTLFLGTDRVVAERDHYTGRALQI